MEINKLDKRLQNLIPEIWSKLNEIDQLRGQWITGAQISPQVLGRLKKSTLITSTGASTRIEGAQLSDEDVEKLIHGLAIQKFTNRDKQKENQVRMLNESSEITDVVLFDTTPAYLTPKEMQEVVEWTQNALKERK